MYALGADFSLPGTQAIARTLSRDYDLSSTGQAVLLFSRIAKVQQIDCNAAGLHTCPNLNLPVFTQRIVMGNPALRTSQFGTPPAAYIGSGGNIASVNYCQQTSLIADRLQFGADAQPPGSRRRWWKGISRCPISTFWASPIRAEDIMFASCFDPGAAPAGNRRGAGVSCC